MTSLFSPLPRRGVLLVVVGFIGLACGSSRPLLSVDVTSDQPYTGVKLRFTAGTSLDKSFSPVDLSPTAAFRAGLYLNGLKGAVTLVAEADNGQCVVARQSVSIPDVDKVSGAVKMVVMMVTGCEPPRSDGGVDAGGDQSAGTGGSGTGGSGTGGAGTGGNGTGGLGMGGSGTGGRGTGGAGTGGSADGGRGTGGGGLGTGGAGTGGRGTGGAGTGGAGTGGAGTGGAGTGGAGTGGAGTGGAGTGGAGTGGGGGGGGATGGAGGASLSCSGWGPPADMCEKESVGFTYTCNCPGFSGCLYYRFADSACSTCSPYSCSGFATNGTEYGPVGNDPRYVSCKCANCVGDLSNIGTGNFSITFTLTTTTLNGTVINQRSVCTNGQMWDVRISSTGTLHVETDDGSMESNYTTLDSAVVVTDGAHHDVLITRMNGTLLLSIDGVEHESAPSSANFGTLAPLQIKTDVCAGMGTNVALAGAVTNVCVTY